MMKVCFKCKVEQPFEDFYVNRNNADGRHTYCKTCQRALLATYQASEKGKAAALLRRTDLTKRYNGIKRNADNRGLEWSLTRAQFNLLIILPCHYCNNGIGPTTGLDRTDNSRGYMVDNVVPCCWWCNTVKGSLLSQVDMLYLAQFVLGHVKKLPLPSGARYYTKKLDGGCVGWRGRKYYGRPVWLLWLQRAVWEETNGPLPTKATVNQTCETVGCLAVEHLAVKERLPRVPASQCRHCGGLLRRDRANKTYCPICNRNRMRERRRVQDNQQPNLP